MESFLFLAFIMTSVVTPWGIAVVFFAFLISCLSRVFLRSALFKNLHTAFSFVLLFFSGPRHHVRPAWICTNWRQLAHTDVFFNGPRCAIQCWLVAWLANRGPRATGGARTEQLDIRSIPDSN